MTAENSRWENNELQFARLLCEIVAAQKLEMPSLCRSMNLEPHQIQTLLDRADAIWEDAKRETADYED